MEMMGGVFGLLFFAILYVAALIVPVVFLIWFYRAVTQLNASVAGIRDELRRIANSAAEPVRRA